MKTSLFTVSFAGFWGQHRLTLEESIKKAAQLGFQGVEIMGKRPHLSPLDYSLDDCRRLRDLVKAEGLSVSAVGAYTNFTGGMEAAEVPFLEMQVDYVSALAARAACLDCRLVRVFSSYERDDAPFFAQWKRTVEGLRECCDRAAEFSVILGLQNHHDLGVSTTMLEELITQVDRQNLIPMFDCWSVHLRGEPVLGLAKKMAPRMQFTTVADYIVLPRSRYRPDLVNYEDQTPFVMAVPMGEGELNYQDFFTGLRSGGFEGWVSYEMCSPLRAGGKLETLEHYAQQFLAYMQKHGLNKGPSSPRA
jgi:sugar phosphate isomerase/epimerase